MKRLALGFSLIFLLTVAAIAYAEGHGWWGGGMMGGGQGGWYCPYCGQWQGGYGMGPGMMGGGMMGPGMMGGGM
ncbi:MAG: hypothetical protein AB1638_06460, partial [Nitrospirota bacterium]